MAKGIVGQQTADSWKFLLLFRTPHFNLCHPLFCVSPEVNEIGNDGKKLFNLARRALSFDKLYKGWSSRPNPEDRISKKQMAEYSTRGPKSFGPNIWLNFHLFNFVVLIEKVKKSADLPKLSET